MNTCACSRGGRTFARRPLRVEMPQTAPRSSSDTGADVECHASGRDANARNTAAMQTPMAHRCIFTIASCELKSSYCQQFEHSLSKFSTGNFRNQFRGVRWIAPTEYEVRAAAVARNSEHVRAEKAQEPVAGNIAFSWCRFETLRNKPSPVTSPLHREGHR